ncbi:MAG TPA: HD domain-containing phosphohydrolase, partial [Candidatus Caenarcaniphilales bacterium]
RRDPTVDSVSLFTPNPKILLVDDQQLNRCLVRSILIEQGYDVLEADRGPASIARVIEEHPDLIILDIKMPEMDGLEICRRLKQNEQTRLIPVVFITALPDQRLRIQAIEAGGDDFLIKPCDPHELLARVRSLIHQKRLNEDLDHTEQVLFAIARTVESRDPNTGNHCERLMTLSQAFGAFLNLSRPAVRDLMWGSYLHDIGKVGIPDAVLLKPSKLTPGELAIMKQHVLIGEQICQPLRTLQGVLPIIRHHHERWDGSGYPDHLVGDEIPYLVQVFQVIDIYDALTSERPYKSASTPEEALQILAAETAQGWRNPELIRQFCEFIQLSEVVTIPSTVGAAQPTAVRK